MENSKHSLAQNFTSLSLFKFIFPILITLVFMSMYTSIDGAFVSRLVSEEALASVNLVYPITNVIMALALMMATGGSAVVSKYLGQQKKEKAQEFFTFIYIVGGILGIIIGIINFVFLEKILLFLGCTTETLMAYGYSYFSILNLFTPILFMQMFAQIFLLASGNVALGMVISILGGIANIIFDYVFMEIMEIGIKGAGLATGIGYSVSGLYGIFHFTKYKNGDLAFVKLNDGISKFKQDFLKACGNGSSEMVNNIALAITTLLFNLIMLHFAGEDGVTAITVILYLQFIQAAIYFGYGQGIIPIIAYKYGEDNKKQLKFLMNFSIKFIMIMSVGVVILSYIFKNQAIGLFIEDGSPTLPIANEGFIIFTISYLFMGMNIFISSMFTAFGNGKISAFLSMLRSFVLLVGALITFPMFWGLYGVWWAVPVAEGVTFLVSIYFYKKYRGIYGY